jgi:hypothetical protein
MSRSIARSPARHQKAPARGPQRWAAAIVLVLTSATVAAGAVPTPTVSGPITSPGSAFLTPPSTLDWSSYGYVEEEFFVAGTATAYTAAAALSSDGLWTASAGDTAPYVTRILVRRPVDPKRFNGTAVVEWLNVSGGLDGAPDWTFAHTMLLRDGFVWVGVSAQFVGVEGGGSPLGLNLSLKAVSPARYGSLSHPGDSFSYDMFSQVAQALRQPAGIAPLGGLRLRRVLAIGESQSAGRLVTYIDAVHPLARVYDGFLVHSRGGGGAPLSQSPQPSITAPTPTFVRTDVDVPVLIFETETDLITLGFLPARQPDTRRIRLWEVAGTSHYDAYGLVVGPDDRGPAAIDTTYLPPMTSAFGGIISCALPINAGPQHYVLSAALSRLHRWARAGRAQGASAPRLEIAAGAPPTIARDALGNARGGIRTAQVDAAVAALSGLGQSGSAFCSIFGTTTPFDAAMLATLYPSHAAYISRVLDATRRAVRAGFVLKADAKAIRAAAAASDVGR